MPMKKSVRDKWVADLRSGQYAQARGTLVEREVETVAKQITGFCCLGVLCVSTQHEPKFSSLQDVTGGFFYLPEYEDENDNGIREDGELLSGDFGLDSGTIKQLINMNDGDRLNFPAIADWIEANIPVED